MSPKSINILLIEDNADHVELIIKTLREDNVLNEVHVVASGEEAMDFLCRRGAYVDAPQPELILLDIKLPGMNGLEFLMWIKADPKLKIIPVVVLSTSASDQEITESYRHGANSYIIKPVDFKHFIKAIKDLKLYWMITSTLPS